jgi:hypothetical protein
MLKVSVILAELPSIDVTITSTTPKSSSEGVPEKVLLAGLNEIQAGVLPPMDMSALVNRTSPGSTSVNVFGSRTNKNFFPGSAAVSGIALLSIGASLTPVM